MYALLDKLPTDIHSDALVQHFQSVQSPHDGVMRRSLGLMDSEGTTPTQVEQIQVFVEQYNNGNIGMTRRGNIVAVDSDGRVDDSVIHITTRPSSRRANKETKSLLPVM